MESNKSKSRDLQVLMEASWIFIPLSTTLEYGLSRLIIYGPVSAGRERFVKRTGVAAPAQRRREAFHAKTRNFLLLLIFSDERNGPASRQRLTGNSDDIFNVVNKAPYRFAVSFFGTAHARHLVTREKKFSAFKASGTRTEARYLCREPPAARWRLSSRRRRHRSIINFTHDASS
ncbi:hypothetical protein EVAR_26804_1 [Eumeta japonica]|uniref:Uncharacterized protein n=1 Tax=Eumeta variegata TaxID=151549 RepID=A0A4C1WCH1_EUMVA|nr:hypothetical protein EVAR_26804_1 [Eumeta japonica]